MQSRKQTTEDKNADGWKQMEKHLIYLVFGYGGMYATWWITGACRHTLIEYFARLGDRYEVLTVDEAQQRQIHIDRSIYTFEAYRHKFGRSHRRQLRQLRRKRRGKKLPKLFCTAWFGVLLCFHFVYYPVAFLYLRVRNLRTGLMPYLRVYNLAWAVFELKPYLPLPKSLGGYFAHGSYQDSHLLIMNNILKIRKRLKGRQ